MTTHFQIAPRGARPSSSTILVLYSHGNVDLDFLRPLLRDAIGGDLHLYLSYRKGNFSQEHRAEHPQMKVVFVELPQRNFDLRLRRLQATYPVETGPSTLGRKQYSLGIRMRFVPEGTVSTSADRATYSEDSKPAAATPARPAVTNTGVDSARRASNHSTSSRANPKKRSRPTRRQARNRKPPPNTPRQLW